MRFTIITVGKGHDPALREAVNDFTLRIGHYFPIEWNIVPSSTKEGEAEKILKMIDQADTLVVLDEKGKSLSSIALAGYIEKKLNESSKKIVWVIGGAYGVAPILLARANIQLSLSVLTFPHQLVRLILAEQLYRACTILKGEKYHHE